MTVKVPPGDHKAKIADVRIDENELTVDLETSAGKVTYTQPFKPQIDLTDLRAQGIAGLTWKVGAIHNVPTSTLTSTYREAILGDFDGGDGVRFTLQYSATCYRRGQWRLNVEIAYGEGHEKWGCFDDQDQPMRYFHVEQCALIEANAIAHVLVEDRCSRR